MTATLNGHLITVLTISGSVVLLSLTKDMLFLLKNYVFDAEERLQAALSSPLPSSSPLFDSLPPPRLRDGLENACEHHLLFSKVPVSSQPATSALRSAPNNNNAGSHDETVEAKGGEKHSVVKRVRFAADVVEPTGNGQEYRKRFWSRTTTEQRGEETRQHAHERRHYLGGRAGKKEEEEAVSCVPANRAALYKALRQSQRQRALYSSS